MRPDLRRQIENSSPAKSLSTEATLAVKSEVLEEHVDDVSNSSQQVFHATADTSREEKGCPNDLSRSDMLSALFREVAHLRQRCDDLEAANFELKADVRAIESTQSALALASGPGKVPVNLTGYASSESTDVSEPSMDGKLIRNSAFDHLR